MRSDRPPARKGPVDSTRRRFRRLFLISCTAVSVLHPASAQPVDLGNQPLPFVERGDAAEGQGIGGAVRIEADRIGVFADPHGVTPAADAWVTLPGARSDGILTLKYPIAARRAEPSGSVDLGGGRQVRFQPWPGVDARVNASQRRWRARFSLSAQDLPVLRFAPVGEGLAAEGPRLRWLVPGLLDPTTAVVGVDDHLSRRFTLDLWARGADGEPIPVSWHLDGGTAGVALDGPASGEVEVGVSLLYSPFRPPADVDARGDLAVAVGNSRFLEGSAAQRPWITTLSADGLESSTTLAEPGHGLRASGVAVAADGRVYVTGQRTSESGSRAFLWSLDLEGGAVQPIDAVA
ncbi:MAG: hypothetical protein AAFY88_13680, partial [Acidobacteriota bacterium]